MTVENEKEEKSARQSKSRDSLGKILYTEQDRLIWKILMRDNFRCRNCGAKAILKIVPFDTSLNKIVSRPTKAYTVNTYTLCKTCEKKITSADQIKTFTTGPKHYKNKWHIK